MAYGTLKADKITYDNGGTDTEVNVSDIVSKANLASPAFTGTPTAPTAAANTNTTQLATTAYVDQSAFAPLASPTFTGTPTVPGYAPLAGATFTGDVTVGADTDGHDVKFFGNTTGKYCLWDESADKLVIEGGLQVNANDTATFKGQTTLEGQVNFAQSGSGDQSVTMGGGNLVFGKTVGNVGFQPSLKMDYDKFEAYYQGNKKLETKTDGVDVSGDLDLTGDITSTGSASFEGGKIETEVLNSIQGRLNIGIGNTYRVRTGGAYAFEVDGGGPDSWANNCRIDLDGNITAVDVTISGVATGGVYDATSDATSAAAAWAIDFADGNNQKVTLVSTNLLSVIPTNQTVGQTGSIFITQPATPLNLGWHADWKWAGGVAPSLTQTGGATDRLDYTILAANTIHAVLTLAVA